MYLYEYLYIHIYAIYSYIHKYVHTLYVHKYILITLVELLNILQLNTYEYIYTYNT